MLLADLVTSDLLVIHSVSTPARLVADLHARCRAPMSADPTAVATALQVLAHLGVTLTDLQSDTGAPAALPTVAEYLPRVVAAAGPGARRTYGTYWERMATAWRDWPLNRVAASDIEAMKQETVATARSRRNSRNGRHAGEHVIAAARAFYSRAVADGLIDAPGHLHALAAAHHPHLGGTPLRLRSRLRLRRPHRQPRFLHHHLYQGRPPRGR